MTVTIRHGSCGTLPDSPVGYVASAEQTGLRSVRRHHAAQLCDSRCLGWGGRRLVGICCLRPVHSHSPFVRRRARGAVAGRGVLPPTCPADDHTARLLARQRRWRAVVASASTRAAFIPVGASLPKFINSSSPARTPIPGVALAPGSIACVPIFAQRRAICANGCNITAQCVQRAVWPAHASLGLSLNAERLWPADAGLERSLNAGSFCPEGAALRWSLNAQVLWLQLRRLHRGGPRLCLLTLQRHGCHLAPARQHSACAARAHERSVPALGRLRRPIMMPVISAFLAHLASQSVRGDRQPRLRRLRPGCCSRVTLRLCP
mmetsp:Transcript_9896/g.29913  ORF Transcript_9896/g.29913 Transcript_9896/m.29913 type:complete len:320 (+) Transcript_9896:309-1268(+)|eukprot:358354-Chlamydomonas_euryale.AAC.6